MNLGLSENLNKEIENKKYDRKHIKNQSDRKNTKTEIKKMLEEMNSRLDEVQDQISDL